MKISECAPSGCCRVISEHIGTNTTVSRSGEVSYIYACIQNSVVERLQSQERQMQLYENMILQNTSRGRAKL